MNYRKNLRNMPLKLEKNFKRLIKIYATEILDGGLKEITTTGDIDGYSTPYAFSKKKKKKKVNEEIEDKDLKVLKLIIRDEVAGILRDIWLKRTTWK